MVYETFLTTVKETLQSRLGDEYGIFIQKIPKNNGTLMDGLCISKSSDRLAPTIYLNTYYEHLKDGTPLTTILDEILHVYTDNSIVPQIDPDILSHFDSLKDKVVYKLIHTSSNEALLKNLPHVPYLDLSIVFYLFLEENEYGHMTALIHEEHMNSWNTTIEELYQLASENTPRLLPADIKSMTEVMQELAKTQLGEDYREEFIEELLSTDDPSPLFVLTNSSGLNGACTILYETPLKNFANLLAQDLIILPSSIHEVLLVPYTESVCFEELYEMVRHINQTEVPVEDRLSNQIYFYNRSEHHITLLPLSSEYPTS